MPSKRFLPSALRPWPSALSPLPFLAGLGVLASLVACDVNVQNGKASFGVLSSEATDEWTHHYPLSAGGRVEIVNINGPVQLSAGPAGTVEVHATITAKSLTDAGAKELLQRGRIRETAEPARVRLETTIPRGVSGSYTVQYDARVPADAVTEISTTNGSLKADGIAGKLKATGVNGRIDLRDVSGGINGIVANGSLTVSLAKVTAQVRLETTNGSLSLTLPADSKANLSARVVNGGLTVTGFQIDQPTGRRIRDLEAGLNGGGPDIDLRTTNGRITVEGK